MPRSNRLYSPVVQLVYKHKLLRVLWIDWSMHSLRERACGARDPRFSICFVALMLLVQVLAHIDLRDIKDRSTVGWRATTTERAARVCLYSVWVAKTRPKWERVGKGDIRRIAVVSSNEEARRRRRRRSRQIRQQSPHHRQTHGSPSSSSSSRSSIDNGVRSSTSASTCYNDLRRRFPTVTAQHPTRCARCVYCCGGTGCSLDRC